MQSNNRILGDLARLASGAMSAAAGARDEMEQMLQYRFERFLNDRGWISREECDATTEMAQKAREQQELVIERLIHLEERLILLEKAKKPLTRKPKTRVKNENK